MSIKDKIDDLLNRGYTDIRTAYNALRFIVDNTQIREYCLVVDGGYGSQIKRVKWLVDGPCYDNGGYPVMFIQYNPDWGQFRSLGAYNVDEETALVCDDNLWQGQKYLVDLAYYFKERADLIEL